MINAILIDDETDGLDDLTEALVKYCPEINVKGAFQLPHDGITAIQQLKPELVFLDVQMPGMSGFEVLQALSPVNFQVIFVSAYDRYAIKAIRFSALDYLLKPIDVDELCQAVSRVKARLKPETFSVQSVIHHSHHDEGRIARMAVPVSEGIDFIETRDVIYCEADSCYTRIHLVNGQVKVVTRVLKDFEELLSESDFCRVHNSFLINLVHVKRYVKGEGGYAVLTGDRHVDISRRRKEEFLSRLHRL